VVDGSHCDQDHSRWMQVVDTAVQAVHRKGLFSPCGWVLEVQNTVVEAEEYEEGRRVDVVDQSWFYASLGGDVRTGGDPVDYVFEAQIERADLLEAEYFDLGRETAMMLENDH
jgi:hypothetical protein